MASKPTIPDSSIGEQQLVPHLRRRLGGTGGSSTTIVGGGTSSGLSALYEGGSDSVTVGDEEWISHALVADTAVLTNADVTGDPWTFTPSTDTYVTVNIAVGYTASCCAAALVAITVDGVDVASGLRSASWTGPVTAGSVVAVWLRVWGCSVEVNGVSVRVTE